MSTNIKYYKIRTIKNLLHKSNQAREQLLNELIINLTDPVIVKRRIRMLEHLNLYETQLVSKIQNFETDNIEDLTSVKIEDYIHAVMHRGA